MPSIELEITSPITRLLEDAEACHALDDDLKGRASTVKHAEKIPWDLVQKLCTELRRANNGEGYWLHEICQGSKLILVPPPVREKSAELKKRLAVLAAQQENRQYEAMVSDVTVKEREAEFLKDSGFKTYTEQLRYGVNVLVIMGTCYALGHTAGRSLFSNPVGAPMLGLVGMIIGMLAETTRFIIWTTVPYKMPVKRRKESPTATSFDKKNA